AKSCCWPMALSPCLASAGRCSNNWRNARAAPTCHLPERQTPMPNAILTAEPPEWYDDVPRSVRYHVMFGAFLLVFAFGGFGVWAFRAPLAAAVISQGSFVATGSNKIVQHLEGGIIKEILVEEGDSVTAGQPIVLLDETSA